MPNPSIAYFCMEFALKDDFHIFSGGLGVLAGDYLLEADRQQLPVIGIGLMYSAIFKQVVSPTGQVSDEEDRLQPEEIGLIPVMNERQQRLSIVLPFQGRKLTCQVWEKKLDHISLFLLDTNIPENPQEFRNITDRLYFGDKDHRLAQEFVLGVGGMRFVEQLKKTVDIVHMNEGHAAFCAFERIAQLMKTKQLSFEDALQESKKTLVFTNHTLIPAGNDTFQNELVTIYLASFAEEAGIDVQKLLELGNIANSSLFSMTFLGLRTAGKTNAVSVYHSEKANEMWPDYPLLAVTNGVFCSRWYAPEKAQVWPLDQEKLPEPREWWNAHQESKEHLAEFVIKRTGKKIATQGLVVTWARRFVQYKRPEALFWQLDWLEHILKNAGISISIIFAGKGHPHDLVAREMVEHVVQISHQPRFAPYITYIPDYNLEVAEHLTQGSDVWLNTPVEGFEACGTSGMKAGLNGVLQCTTNDGWVREVSWHDIGWKLNNEQISESLYDMLENHIIPLFMQRDSNALPKQWIERMLETSRIMRTQYSATRMLKQYHEMMYSDSVL